MGRCGSQDVVDVLQAVDYMMGTLKKGNPTKLFICSSSHSHGPQPSGQHHVNALHLQHPQLVPIPVGSDSKLSIRWSSHHACRACAVCAVCVAPTKRRLGGARHTSDDKKNIERSGIGTHASEDTSALNCRLRPLGPCWP